MNMAYNNANQDQNMEYVDGTQRAESFQKIKPRRRPAYSRGGKAPCAYNGIHRRRNKRFSW